MSPRFGRLHESVLDDASLLSADVHLYGWLACHADYIEQTFSGSRREISEGVRMTDRTVRRCLGRLEKGGHIVRDGRLISLPKPDMSVRSPVSGHQCPPNRT